MTNFIDPRLPANPRANEKYLSLLNIRLTEIIRDIYIRFSNMSDEVVLADGSQLSAFGRLKVSNANTMFDSQQEYGLDTLHSWDITANGTLPTYLGANGSVSSGGNSVGPINANSRLTPITVSATDTHYAVMQSRQYVRYIPGKGHMIYMTGVFAAGAGYTASFTVRTSTSGSVSDSLTAAQTAWNVDKFDGKGPSGEVLDLTKIQILVIDAQMLYAGRVRFGFDISGCLHWAHYFNIANESTLPTMQTFNLPVRFEGRTGASSTTYRAGYFDSANGVFLETTRTTKGGTAYFECCSVQSEGDGESRGFPKTASNGTTTISVTTRRPVLSIRPRQEFNGMTNRAHIELLDYTLRAATNDSFYEIVAGGTLTGASFVPVGAPITAGSFIVGQRYVILTIGTTDYTLIGAASNTVGVAFAATGVGVGTGTAVIEASIAEYDVSATTITGGEIIASGFAVSAAGNNASFSGGEIDPRNPLVLSKIDALTANQIPVSVVCTAISGTSVISAGLRWHEQTT